MTAIAHGSTGSLTVGPGASDPAPAELWRLFAPAIAGDAARPKMRVSRDGARSYPARYERRVDPHKRPPQPAAVLLYGPDACARTLALDLDATTAKGGVPQVIADTDMALRLFAQAGIQVIVDESPAGGRHLLIPLARRRGLEELRPVLTALSATLRSLDPTPMLNVRAGCLRPPGAVHRSGGHQRLITPFAAATAVLTSPASDAAWQRLVDAVCPDLPAGHQQQSAPVGPPTSPSGPRTPLPARYEVLARTGHLPGNAGHGYATRSEARQAVLTSAAARGWEFTDVSARISAGRWPGLLSLYDGKRTQSSRLRALRRDWQAALVFLAKHPPNQTKSSVHYSPTSPLHSHRRSEEASRSTARTPAEWQFIREWWTAVSLAHGRRWKGAASLSAVAVLSSLGAAAHKTGHRSVAFGVRSLSLAAGRDHTVVAALFRSLRAEHDPFVVHVGAAQGTTADRYELRIPEEYHAAATARPWPAGALPEVEQIFAGGREGLGLAAWWTWHALTQRPAPVAALADATRLSRSGLYGSLELLAEHGLAQRDPGGWVLGPISAAAVATASGADDRWLQRLQRIREERTSWRAWLENHGIPAGRHLQVVPEPGPDEDDVPPPGEPPPDDETPLELLNRVLGAVLIDPAA